MTEILEAAMLVCFGVSWPVSIIKSYKARTAKGKSLLFLSLILIGYILGAVNKLFYHETITYVVYFYFLNMITVSTDIVIYFRNRRLDKR